MNDKIKILVVDEDEMVLSSVKAMLEDSYDVAMTISPKVGLWILENKPYEIVLVNLMMDEMYGVDFIHAAKIIQPSILSIVITGCGSKNLIVESLKAKVYDFLEKPLTPLKVQHAVDMACKELQTELLNH